MAQRQRCASAGLRPGQLEKPSFRRCDVRCKKQVHGRPVVLVNHPIRYDDQIPELRVKGITVGEHTREILAEHGDNQAQIDGLFARRVVGGPSNTDPDGAQGASGAVTA
jgi:crotonobetainyl-CoA:carnitine CoA-transferase CaiB-like acyl-CoA transferase